MGLSVIIRFVFLGLTVRLLAVGLGAEGFALAMQLLTLVGLVTLVAGGGVSVGLTNLYGQTIGDSKANGSAVRLAVFLGVLFGAGIGVCLHNSATFISLLLFGDSQRTAQIRFFSLFIWVIGVQINLSACITASNHRVLNSVAMSCSAICLYLFVLYGMGHHGVDGALTAITLGSLPVACISMFWASFLRKNERLISPVNTSSLKTTKAQLLGFAVVTLFSAFFSTVPQLFVRQHIGESIAWAEAGKWSALIKTSEIYCQIFIIYLAQFHHPNLMRAVALGEVKKVIFQAQIKIAVVAASLFLVLVFTSDLWFTIAFGKDINVSKTELSLVMVGDICKLVSYCATYLLIIRNRIALMLCLEATQAVLIYGLGVYFFDSLSSRGFIVGYCVGHVLYLFFVLTLINSEFRRENP